LEVIFLSLCLLYLCGKIVGVTIKGCESRGKCVYVSLELLVCLGQRRNGRFVRLDLLGVRLFDRVQFIAICLWDVINERLFLCDLRLEVRNRGRIHCDGLFFGGYGLRSCRDLGVYLGKLRLEVSDFSGLGSKVLCVLVK